MSGVGSSNSQLARSLRDQKGRERREKLAMSQLTSPGLSDIWVMAGKHRPPRTPNSDRQRTSGHQIRDRPSPIPHREGFGQTNGGTGRESSERKEKEKEIERFRESTIPGPNSSFLTAGVLIYACRAGITVAASTEPHRYCSSLPPRAESG